MSIEFTASSTNQRVFGRLNNLDKLTSRGIRAGMFDVGNGLIKRASTNIISGTKSGRVYKVRGRRHRSSAPGETHANLSGAARRSLSYQLRGVSSLEFGYGVSSGKGAPEYVEFLEFGTRKMKPRPTLHNALRDEQGNMVQRFENQIGKTLR